MFNVSLYDVDIEIKIYHGGMLVAKATQRDTAWMEVEVDNMTGYFDLLGISQMHLDFIMDDDHIVFKTSKDGDLVVVTISKSGIAKMLGGMLEYLAGTTLSLFGRDED